MPGIIFKQATEEAEMDQIHALNYAAFVEEIPQHPPNSARRLVDKFHAENTYMIAVLNGSVVGMVAVRANRPFSLDAKLPDLDAYLPPGRSLCEVRLLAIRPAHRNRFVLAGLLERVAAYSLAHGYDLGLISGTVRQLKLYRHMGAVPFGPLVGPPEARYQPMFIPMEALQAALAPVLAAARIRARTG